MYRFSMSSGEQHSATAEGPALRNHPRPALKGPTPNLTSNTAHLLSQLSGAVVTGFIDFNPLVMYPTSGRRPLPDSGIAVRQPPASEEGRTSLQYGTIRP